MEMKGTVHNGVVVVQHPELLPEGAEVTVRVEGSARPAPTPAQKPALAERLLKHAGTVPDLPADLAEQHDHYVHGTPKR
jgi:hypothetical protein